ncbi:MAG TPA: hypothetical protein V6D18_17085 [Thermosynechococcaceae cyanobacterium]
MTNEFSSDEDAHFQAAIQQNLQEVAIQLGKSLDLDSAAQIYQEAYDLLGHISYAPITLARVAGTLLVYQAQEAEAEELKWFKLQVRQCPDDEEVEELIESIHRTDAL